MSHFKTNSNSTFRRFLLSILSVSIASNAFAFVEMEMRKPVEMEDGTLTPFWAQEYIGADLVKEEMKALPNLRRIPFAVYDSGFEKKHIRLSFDIPVDTAFNGNRPVKGHHGTSVANIVNGTGMKSVSEIVDYVHLKRVSPAVFYFGVVKEMQTLPVKPQVISNSMGWTSPQVLELAQQVDQMGVIWVMASGNDHPEKIVEYERIAPVIAVGSYSPRGLQTRSSQESDQLDILAPADEYQASIDGNGAETLFGGTSGATPLVSGSIANIKSLLPGLTRQQVESLMKRTAIRSLHSYYSRTNKTGLFNAYKMFHVALRLKNICGDDGACLQKEIDQRKNYAFIPENLDTKSLMACQNKEALPKNSMENLRRNFLLNPNNTAYARLLSCAYRNEGFSINADYYENMALIYDSPGKLQEKIQKEAVKAIEQRYLESAALRDAEILNDSYKEALLKAIAEDSGIGAHRAKELLQIYENTPKVRPLGL